MDKKSYWTRFISTLSSLLFFLIGNCYSLDLYVSKNGNDSNPGTAVMPSLAQHLHDTKHQYGWTHESPLPDGSLEMTFLIGSFPYMATWLLPFAGAVTIVEPEELRIHLSTLARRAYELFALSGLDSSE